MLPAVGWSEHECLLPDDGVCIRDIKTRPTTRTTTFLMWPEALALALERVMGVGESWTLSSHVTPDMWRHNRRPGTDGVVLTPRVETTELSESR